LEWLRTLPNSIVIAGYILTLSSHYYRPARAMRNKHAVSRAYSHLLSGAVAYSSRLVRITSALRLPAADAIQVNNVLVMVKSFNRGNFVSNIKIKTYK